MKDIIIAFLLAYILESKPIWEEKPVGLIFWLFIGIYGCIWTFKNLYMEVLFGVKEVCDSSDDSIARPMYLKKRIGKGKRDRRI